MCHTGPRYTQRNPLAGRDATLCWCQVCGLSHAAPLSSTLILSSLKIALRPANPLPHQGP